MPNDSHISNNDPLAIFTVNLESWHIALLYEEPEHARIIEYRFIREGLKLGQRCCYIVHGNRDFIANEMSDNGIDVDHYSRNSMLCMIESIDILRDPVGVAGATQKLCAASTVPFRVVGGLSSGEAATIINNNSVIADRITKVQLEIEHNFHNQLFKGVQGYWLCPYSVNDIKIALGGGNDDLNLLMVTLLKSHDGAVLVTKSGKGLSVFMP